MMNHDFSVDPCLLFDSSVILVVVVVVVVVVVIKYLLYQSQFACLLVPFLSHIY